MNIFFGTATASFRGESGKFAAFSRGPGTGPVSAMSRRLVALTRRDRLHKFRPAKFEEPCDEAEPPPGQPVLLLRPLRQAAGMVARRARGSAIWGFASVGGRPRAPGRGRRALAGDPWHPDRLASRDRRRLGHRGDRDRDV